MWLLISSVSGTASSTLPKENPQLMILKAFSSPHISANNLWGKNTRRVWKRMRSIPLAWNTLCTNSNTTTINSPYSSPKFGFFGHWMYIAMKYCCNFHGLEQNTNDPYTLHCRVAPAKTAAWTSQQLWGREKISSHQLHLASIVYNLLTQLLESC